MNTNAATRERFAAHRPTALRRRALPMLIAGCFSTALANPLGPQVVNGQVGFSNQGSVLSITNTPGAIINWQSFSINPGELTRFIQQNPNSAVLNRIVGQDPSQILGALQSNGRVFLINPNGILFGQGAQVDVNGLVASTLNLSNEDFLNGKLNFKAGDKAASLKNQGVISTPAGGQVYLIAPNVENSGIITSPKGEVLLAAGHTVQLVDSMNPDLHVVVSAPENEALNLGQVIAQGGKTGIYGALVRQRGIINANSAVIGENGKVVLKASGDTLLEAGSRTTATGAGKGGEIQVLGERVGLTGDAVVDASGALGGGTVLIGGDFQGKNADIRKAKRTFVGQEVTIKADGMQTGDGGKVIVWSDEATRFYGDISARGAGHGGDGGFAEVSGKQYLDFQGLADLGASNGQAGTLLLDPNDITIQTTGTTDVALSGGPNFTYDGGPSSAILTVADLESQLSSGSVVLKTTTGAGGTNGGRITVANALAWSSGNTLSLWADNGILVNGLISNTGTGILGLRTTAGDITQSAAIQVPSLVAYADSGTVALNHASNNITKLAGFAGNAGSGFSFTNTNGISIGTLTATPIGLFNGISSNAKPISVTASNGNLDINSTDVDYGVLGGSANVSLIAANGTVSQTAGKITAANLSVTAGNAISLGGTGNLVASLTAAQTSAGGTNIAFLNDGALSVTSVTQGSTATSSINISTTDTNNLTVAGPITAGALSSISLKAGTGGSLLRSGSGLVTANTIMLQNDSSGALGTSGTRFQTSSHVGGNASITIGATSGPGDVYLTHGGDATLNTMTVGASAPVEISAIGDLTTSSITTTGSLSLTAGDLLTIPALKTLSAANITLTADRMALLNAAGATNAGAGVLRLMPKTSNWNIDLGASATDVAGNTLELSTNELDTLAGTGSLKIGALTAGDLHVSAAIAPTYAGALLLEAGGNLTQAAAGTISAPNLAIDAWGDVTLNTAANMVTNLAASVGTGGSNKNFRFKNGALNIGSNIAGKSGISINMSGTYSSAVPNGVIVLESSGALTQSAGATLGGKGVYAEGTSVTLTQNNATGIIAGKATGGLATDRFTYTSANTISVNKVNGFAGISHAGAADPESVKLSGGGTGIFQTTASFGGFDSPIISTLGGGLKLVTSGMIDLSASTNSVGRLTAVNTGALKFLNSGALLLGVSGSDGISTSGNQSMKIVAGGLMTVVEAISAGTGNIDLEADSLALDDTVTAGIVSISPYTAARKITVGSTTCDVAPCLNVTKLYNVVAPTIGIGAEVDDSKPAGAIHVAGITGAGTGVDQRNAATTRIGLLTGAGVTQGGVIDVQDLGISAGGTVNLPLANSVSNFAAETFGASLTFDNASALNITTLSGGSVTDSSEYTVSGINTNGNAISLSAGGAIEGNGTIKGSTLSMTAASGIGHAAALSTEVSVLNATNTGANTNINISNVGALTIGTVTQANGSTGSITIDNDGALTVGTLVSSDGGPISLVAHSPLTVSGTVQSDTHITLVAHATGVPGAGDTLTINGSVLSGGGNINLSAGDEIVIANPANVNTGDGIVTQTPHLNGMPAPSAPTLAQCTATPTLSGCATVLPTLLACTTTPTLEGCSVVLPTLSICTTAPATEGCAAVLPTLSACTITPTLEGCTAVLPTLSACTTTPTLAGCTAVLPTLSACTTTPTLAGCTTVLPTLSACTTTPTLAGCTAVLPTLSACTTTPTLAGCTTVLPTLSACTTTPTLAGCTAVLPTVAACTITQTLEGCTAVLPTLSACTTTPTLAGCTVILPTLSSCTTTPTAAGCTAVLPSVSLCTTTPALEGCSVVLPTLGSCTTTPTLAGCSAVLPSLSQCTVTPTLAGCTAVLPSLSDCSANPTLAGCSVVVPIASKCVTNPSLPECATVLPPPTTPTTPTLTADTISTTVNSTVNTIVLSTVTLQSRTVTEQASSGAASGSSPTASKSASKSAEKSEEAKDEKKDDKKTTAGLDDSGAKKNEAAKKMYCN